MATECGAFAIKSILLLGDTPDGALLAVLREGLWKPRTLQPGLPCPASLEARHPRIGLVCLLRGAPDARLHDAIRTLSDVDWIAVVSPDNASQSCVREFIARHCVGYQTAPIEKERLLYALGHAAGMRNLLGSASGEARLAEGHFPIVGNSAPIRALRHDLLKIAAADAPVMVTGESGTGKELAARIIHEQSRRLNQPFVAINCAALSPSLIHAELFGAERGAFTGADARRVGHLESANHGTIFLDEIGDLDPDLQGLLLRFLEEKTVRRLGGREQIPVNVRIVAATNANLEADVKSGRFREDLYYRLNVIRVRMPALRDRREDIPLLAATFLARIVAEHGRRIDGFSMQALAAMRVYDWPGNVRELLNRIRRAAILGEGRVIDAAELELTTDVAIEIATLDRTRGEAERQAILLGLSHSNGNAREAAEILGVSRATLYRLLEKHRMLANADEVPSHL